MLLEWIFLLLLILLNGVFAMSELAVVSAREARLRHRAQQGSSRAAAALRLLQDPNNFLSTVQIGITLIGTLAGAFSGATLARHIEPTLRNAPILAEYSEAMSLALMVLLISYLNLVLGELVPKRLALLHAENIAMLIAVPMRGLAWLLSPIVRLLSWSTEGLLWLLGVRASEKPPVTPEEINVLMAQGLEAGIFEAAEQGIVQNALRLDSITVTELMTPRPELVWIDSDASLEEVYSKMRQYNRSWYPVFEGERLKPVGMVAVKDVWARSLEGASPRLQEIMRQPLLIPESTNGLEALELMKKHRARVALVVDEYLHTQGIISVTDIMQALIEDLDEVLLDNEAPNIVQREDGSWLVDGMIPIEELNAYFEVTLNTEEKYPNVQYQTLGGFVMTRLGRIPQPSDHFTWQGWAFEVMDMDGARVDKVLVSRQDAASVP